jgi:caa(3)-type oxidase subunit IV
MRIRFSVYTTALTKALIVLAIFMELRERHALTIAFAGAGFFWLAIMLWLALADFVTRPDCPPRAAVSGMAIAGRPPTR